MTNEMVAIFKIEEQKGEQTKINAFAEKLRQLADYFESQNFLPAMGHVYETEFFVKELKRCGGITEME